MLRNLTVKSLTVAVVVATSLLLAVVGGLDLHNTNASVEVAPEIRSVG